MDAMNKLYFLLWLVLKQTKYQDCLNYLYIILNNKIENKI